jgi:hypothetical protein
MMRILTFTVVVLALAGCGGGATLHLLPEATAVRTAKADPPATAVELGPIEGVHGGGCGLFGSRSTTARTPTCATGRWRWAPRRCGSS